MQLSFEVGDAEARAWPVVDEGVPPKRGRILA
jgi:hypothetical protein